MWEGGARRRWMISSPTTCHRGIASGSGSGDGCSGTARRRRVVTLQHPARGRQRSKMPSAEASRRLVEMLPHARPRGLTSSWEAGILSPNIDRGSSLSALRNKDNSAIAKHGSSLPLSVEPVLCRLNLEKIATTLNQLANPLCRLPALPRTRRKRNASSRPSENPKKNPQKNRLCVSSVYFLRSPGQAPYVTVTEGRQAIPSSHPKPC
jgi:hypothetical protein